MFFVNGAMTALNSSGVQLNGRANSSSASKSQIQYGIFETDKGINGVIDEGVFQGDTGDCWLISGVLSMSYTDEGAKMIKDAISQNADGSYNVYFKGIDKSYTISQDELRSKNMPVLQDALNVNKSVYSTGDDDMLLMECALEKVVEDETVPIDTVQGLTGGSAYYLYQLFTDKQVAYVYGEDDNKALNTMLDYYDTYQDSCSATIGVIDGFLGLEDDHAYAVKSLHNGVMTLVNPWNSTQDINVSLKDMLRNSQNYDMSLVDYDLPELTNWYNEFYA